MCSNLVQISQRCSKASTDGCSCRTVPYRHSYTATNLFPIVTSHASNYYIRTPPSPSRLAISLTTFKLSSPTVNTTIKMFPQPRDTLIEVCTKCGERADNLASRRFGHEAVCKGVGVGGSSSSAQQPTLEECNKCGKMGEFLGSIDDGGRKCKTCPHCEHKEIQCAESKCRKWKTPDQYGGVGRGSRRSRNCAECRVSGPVGFSSCSTNEFPAT